MVAFGNAVQDCDEVAASMIFVPGYLRAALSSGAADYTFG